MVRYRGGPQVQVGGIAAPCHLSRGSGGEPQGPRYVDVKELDDPHCKISGSLLGPSLIEHHRTGHAFRSFQFSFSLSWARQFRLSPWLVRRSLIIKGLEPPGAIRICYTRPTFVPSDHPHSAASWHTRVSSEASGRAGRRAGAVMMAGEPPRPRLHQDRLLQA